jgi:hydrogenase maturation protease
VPSAPRAERDLLVGVGSNERSDDRVGLEVARALRDRPELSVDIVEAAGDLTDLLDLWSGRVRVILVDAIRTGAPAGTIQRWDGASLDRLPPEATVSSHGLSLLALLHLARALGRRPPDVTVWGIEIADAGPGERLTEAVARAVPEACRRIAADLADAGPEARRPGGRHA